MNEKEKLPFLAIQGTNYIEHEKKNPNPKTIYKTDIFCLNVSKNYYI